MNYNYELQKKALEVAEELRKRIPGFYYGMLIKSSNIKPGICFRGNQGYCEVSLVQAGTIHMTNAIYLSVHNGGFNIAIIYQDDNSTWLTREDCDAMVSHISNVLHVDCDTKRYKLDQVQDWWTRDLTMDEAEAVCRYIISFLKNHTYEHYKKEVSLLYDQEVFEKQLKKHLVTTLQRNADGSLSYIEPSEEEQIENEEEAAEEETERTLALEYPVAGYLTQFDGKDFSQAELVKALKDCTNSELGKVSGIHIFGMLYPEQIGSQAKKLAQDAFGQESFQVEINKGVRLGQYLRSLIRDGFMPISTDGVDDIYRKYLTALRTKPFMLLAGISGTGKSRIVREMAYRACPDIDDLRKDKTTPGNYLMVEVKPNWHDSTELLGYYSNISHKYHFTKFVEFLVKAMRYPEVPFFVCLDEMNLAPVEQYFAEFLSVLETRRHAGAGIKTGMLVEAKYMNELMGWTGGNLTLPENVFIIGTVNMDDTTHQFSRKVIDRAMTIEMNGDKLEKMFGRSHDLNYVEHPWTMADNLRCHYVTADEMLEKHPRSAQAIKDELVRFLTDVNKVLADTPFGVSYRVLNELCIYLGNLLDEHRPTTEEGLKQMMKQAEDQITLMKILPRIEGDEDMFRGKGELNKLQQLKEQFDQETDSWKKLDEMNKRLSNGGFTRFWP